MNDILKYEGQELREIFQTTIVNGIHEVRHCINGILNNVLNKNNTVLRYYE